MDTDKHKAVTFSADSVLLTTANSDADREMRETESGATVLGEHINADGSVAPTLVRTYAGQDGLAHLPQIVEAYEKLSTSDNPRDRAAGIEGLSMLRTPRSTGSRFPTFNV